MRAITDPQAEIEAACNNLFSLHRLIIFRLPASLRMTRLAHFSHLGLVDPMVCLRKPKRDYVSLYRGPAPPAPPPPLMRGTRRARRRQEKLRRRWAYEEAIEAREAADAALGSILEPLVCEPKPKRYRGALELSAEEVRDMRDSYSAGERISSIARRTGRSESTVHAAVDGLHGRRHLTAEQDAAAVELHKQGVSVTELSVRLGITRNGVYRIIKKSCVPA